MTVRSHLPWPLRWALAALALGFSAAIALWAFEFGKSIAGLDKDAKAELVRLRTEVSELREAREKAESIANTADSLLKTEKAAQERLAAQLRQVEADNLSLKGDLAFFERLLPASGQTSDGPQIRSVQADEESPGQLRFQILMMQGSKAAQTFEGRYEITLIGVLDGKPWTQPPAREPNLFQLKQYLRLEGRVQHPPQAVVKLVQVRVLDTRGGVHASQTLHL